MDKRLTKNIGTTSILAGVPALRQIGIPAMPAAIRVGRMTKKENKSTCAERKWK